MRSGPTITPMTRLLRMVTFVAAVLAAGVVGSAALNVIRDRAETTRTTPRYSPPVLAGQNVPGPCSTGGFYARDGETIVLTMAAHCVLANPGVELLDAAGDVVGVFAGDRAEIAECPAGRLCLRSDMSSLRLSPAWIPWGHLDLVDMGAGGYRTLTHNTPPLSCADLRAGDRVEVNGRERFRAGRILEIGPYQHAEDTSFPCMVVTDIKGGPGDSGSAVLVNDLPAGMTSRVISGYLAFTPLAEGLEGLGLVLCRSPDCDTTPH